MIGTLTKFSEPPPYGVVSGLSRSGAGKIQPARWGFLLLR